MKLYELLNVCRCTNLRMILQFPEGDEVKGTVSRLLTLCKEMEVVDFTVGDCLLVVAVK